MAPADQCHLTVSLAQVYNSIRGDEVTFFKLSAGQLFVLIDRRLGFMMKRPIINNFLTSSVRSLQGILRPRP